MTTYEFKIPDFLTGNSPEEIQERMMQNLPSGIDNMPGGFPYDFVMPTALEKSELIQYHLVRTLMLMFPMWAWGEWLDYHGKQKGVTRKPANKASGYVTFEGITGTRVAAGCIVCTAATGSTSSLEFSTDEEVVIPKSGKITVSVTAVLGGIGSNTKEGTVVLMAQPVEGIISLYNEENITGGTDEEDDESYRERVEEAYRSDGNSYVGNDADYIRWAKEVAGVGSAAVIPEWDGPGTVKLILIDSNGQPANEHICEAVFDYIMSPKDRMNRKAPIGAILTVSAPDIIEMHYTAEVELLDGYDIEKIKTAFQENLLVYYDQASVEGEIKYTQIGAVLAKTEGVNDYSNLFVNGGTKNIPIHQYEFPVTQEVVFEKGVVE